jgi:hypothetical protein
LKPISVAGRASAVSILMLIMAIIIDFDVG